MDNVLKVITEFAGFGDFLIAAGISSIGVAMGLGKAGMAAVGSYFKLEKDNKKVPTVMIIASLAAFSQFVYAFVYTLQIPKGLPVEAYNGIMLMSLMVGFGFALVGFFQGSIAAAIVKGLGDNPKAKTVFLYMMIGGIEAVAIFMLVAALMNMPTVA
jgi:F0F1-type ATP synthase membrane subunit c/vacuolar-type H+-ATPase subunit K